LDTQFLCSKGSRNIQVL